MCTEKDRLQSRDLDEYISLEEHEECCWRVYVKSMFAGVMWGMVLSSIFVLRL